MRRPVGTSARPPGGMVSGAATAATEAAGPGFAEAYRRLLDPTAEPAVQVLALGRARDALCALADREGIPYQAPDLEAFL